MDSTCKCDNSGKNFQNSQNLSFHFYLSRFPIFSFSDQFFFPILFLFLFSELTRSVYLRFSCPRSSLIYLLNLSVLLSLFSCSIDIIFICYFASISVVILRTKVVTFICTAYPIVYHFQTFSFSTNCT
jgi:hypothetical protein